MENLFDVIIIGSGPAGLTAAIYASRANLKTLVLAGTKWGGQLMLTSTVENFPGFPEGIQGPELMERMKTQAETFGAKILLENVLSVTPLKTGGFKVNEYESKTVIIATGADTVWLGLPNEARLIGKGVSSCAPCDAFFFKNKKVAVVGGGDSACEEALFLTKFATEVTIIHRRDALRASKIMQDRVKSNPKIKFLNLFGYTGVASLFALRAGAEVTHLDASKQILSWAKENQKLNAELAEAPMRIIEDDAIKFLEREEKRGNKYDAVIMDPPKFGRGPKGEIWKIEEMLPKLLLQVKKVLSDKPFFVILTSYATDSSPLSLGYALVDTMKDFKGKVEQGELCVLEKSNNRVIPLANTAVWRAS